MGVMGRSRRCQAALGCGPSVGAKTACDRQVKKLTVGGVGVGTRRLLRERREVGNPTTLEGAQLLLIRDVERLEFFRNAA